MFGTMPALIMIVENESIPIPHQDLDSIDRPPDEDEEMAVEGIEPPRVSDERNEPVVSAPQVDRLGGEIHPHARGERQHRARSSATSSATYRGSVPASTRTSMLAIERMSDRDSVPTTGLLATTWTGNSATRSDRPSATPRDNFQRHHFKVDVFRPRRTQRSSAVLPDRLNDWLAAAPEAEVVCGELAAMVSVNDLADRAPRGLKDGEDLVLGTKTMMWLDAPHLPHNWECGYMLERTTRTLLCGDLFSHLGDGSAVTEAEVLGPSEQVRQGMGGVAIDKGTRDPLDKLAGLEPAILAIAHGSSYRGDGRGHLLGLAEALCV